MKCPQIFREKTSSQKSHGIALRIQWHFFIKIRWHQEINFAGNTCRIYMPSYFGFEKKIWKKRVLPLWQMTFDPLKKDKKYSSMEQNFFFSSGSEGILLLLFTGTEIRIWGHLYAAGIALQLYSALRFEGLERIQKLRAIPWDFWDEVFSLTIWGHFIQQCITMHNLAVFFVTLEIKPEITIIDFTIKKR